MNDTDGLLLAGFVRLKDLIRPKGPLCLSASFIWAGVADGSFPPPIKLSTRVTAWDVQVIRSHIAEKVKGSR